MNANRISLKASTRFRRSLVFCLFYFVAFCQVLASDFSNTTYIISNGSKSNLDNPNFWNFISNQEHAGIKFELEEKNNSVFVINSNRNLAVVLEKLNQALSLKESKVFPVFLNYNGNLQLLDSVINYSQISSRIFYLPQGETWPAVEYLVQAKRGVIFFISGKYISQSKILHHADNYVFQIPAVENSSVKGINSNLAGINLELFMISDFNNLQVKSFSASLNRSLIPDYINFLLENWMKYGKRPNFIFVGDQFSTFSFIIPQLNSFTYAKGAIKNGSKNMEKVFWKSPEILVTGGTFCFPFRGGEELILSPFSPGFSMSPEKIIVTGEMEVPENFTINATPLQIADGLTGSFDFERTIINSTNPADAYVGENYSFSEDIERGTVLKLPEKSSINLGDPTKFGIRNSSFTVACYVKFSEILEYGDNAVLGNYESQYRRGLHLIIRSGHPYFGLYGNDYVSEEKLKINKWYHLAWRYILETGEQAIFLNGRYIGSSGGHPPFSGTGEIHIGSALSRGASLRGYIDDLNFWSRPLGSEEITRLALNEKIVLLKKAEKPVKTNRLRLLFGGLLFAFCLILIYLLIQNLRKRSQFKEVKEIRLPLNLKNSVLLFGEFRAYDSVGGDVSEFFTPKVKELFLFVLIRSLKNGNGATVSEINETLWTGISPQNVANNRAVTLNKLRKILERISGIEILIQNGFLYSKTTSAFFCDLIELYQLSQTTGKLDKSQLDYFYQLVKAGNFLKGCNWAWLDEVRGYTGNQIIDNLLKLASIYKKENRFDDISAISKRILDYDELNEEAIWLQIWTLQKTNNLHQAKFNFNSFCARYLESMGEPYPLSFDKFIAIFSEQI